MARINRAARPDPITTADRARMAAHVAREDAKRAAAIRRQRIKSFIYGATWSVTGAAAVLYILAHI